MTPWTAARQASLSFTISRSLLKLMSIESVMPSKNHLILCCPHILASTWHTQTSWVVQWFGLFTFSAMARVESLVRELRSCKPSSVTKKKNPTPYFGSGSPFEVDGILSVERGSLNILFLPKTLPLAELLLH